MKQLASGWRDFVQKIAVLKAMKVRLSSSIPTKANPENDL